MKISSQQAGFTLIELLIVVAIIAILAAIAVPNFLEAQTRSKVSAAKNNMRTVSTGLEAYFVDYNHYVNDSDNTIGKGGADGLSRLTTPVAFLTSLAEDPFQLVINKNLDSAARYFELGSGSDNGGWGTVYGSQGVPVVESWLLVSVGPDVEPKNMADDTSSNDEWPWGTACITYDPTNGTISNGDIYRAGGSLKEGNYVVNNVVRGPFN